MSAVSTPLPGDTLPKTSTQITNPRSLTLVRLLWFVLLALELARIAYVLPVSLRPESRRPADVEILIEMGMIQPSLIYGSCCWHWN